MVAYGAEVSKRVGTGRVKSGQEERESGLGAPGEGVGCKLRKCFYIFFLNDGLRSGGLELEVG